ncbi:MAG: capsule biosynthesis protein [Nitrospirota bacterium]
MITGGISLYKGKRVLLLQGPMGPFFRRLAADLERAGAQTVKVDFNGGDWLFSSAGSVAFRGRTEAWPAFFEHLLIDRKIDMVLLFGDCRPMHREAHAIATRRGLEIGVFEEGYIRPDYITLERFGVNGYSLIPRMPAFYFRNPQVHVPSTLHVGRTFGSWAWWTILYYAASILARPLFPHYRHHRPLTAGEAVPWMRSAWRKLKYRVKERGVQAELAGVFSKKYFLVPLQVHNDAQVTIHSGFDEVKGFIDVALASFAAHAPAGTLLVFKHHPMDRGYRDHTRLLRLLSEAYGIRSRVRYIHDQHLPTLLEHARGVVVINSTAGLSALHHGTPVKVCGAAIYDMQGLTYQGTLDEYWKDARDAVIDRELYERYRSYVIGNTQLNGNYYRRLKLPGSSAGLVWPLSSENESGAGAADEQAGLKNTTESGSRDIAGVWLDL